MSAQILQLRPPPSQEDLAMEKRLRKSYEFHQKMADQTFKVWLKTVDRINKAGKDYGR